MEVPQAYPERKTLAPGAVSASRDASGKYWSLRRSADFEICAVSTERRYGGTIVSVACYLGCRRMPYTCACPCGRTISRPT